MFNEYLTKIFLKYKENNSYYFKARKYLNINCD